MAVLPTPIDLLPHRPPFLFGDEPKSADAALGPQILAIATDPFDSPLSDAIQAREQLVPYAKRVLARFFDH